MYIIPESHLELLQGILRELIKARDPEATFMSLAAFLESQEAPAEKEL